MREGSGRSNRDRSRSVRRRPSESSASRKPKDLDKDEKPKGNPVVNAALKNGTTVCAAWSKGKCSKNNCPDKHACNGQNKQDSTRTCGGAHASSVCRSCKRT